MIDVVDDFLEEHLHHKLLDFCEHAQYRYGERDEYGLPPVGMVSDILPDGDKSPFDLFDSRINAEFNTGCPYRMYVNCFAPGEIPFGIKMELKDLHTFTILIYIGNQICLEKLNF